MEPFVPVADELLLQGAAVVLEVPQDEDTADVLGRDDVDAVIGRTGQDRQAGWLSTAAWSMSVWRDWGMK